MSPDRKWTRVPKIDRALALATPEEARTIRRKALRAALRAVMTSRQGLRQAHDAHVARTGVCTCATGEPNPIRPGWQLDLCKRVTETNAIVCQALVELEALGPPEPGEDKSRWHLR